MRFQKSFPSTRKTFGFPWKLFHAYCWPRCFLACVAPAAGQKTPGSAIGVKNVFLGTQNVFLVLGTTFLATSYIPGTRKILGHNFFGKYGTKNLSSASDSYQPIIFLWNLNFREFFPSSVFQNTYWAFFHFTRFLRPKWAHFTQSFLMISCSPKYIRQVPEKLWIWRCNAILTFSLFYAYGRYSKFDTCRFIFLAHIFRFWCSLFEVPGKLYTSGTSNWKVIIFNM